MGKDNAKLQRRGRSLLLHILLSVGAYPFLISENLAFRSLDFVKDSQGWYIIVKGILAGKEVTFMNLYCPPAYSPDFLSKTLAVFMEHASGTLVGDFNCHLNPSLDKLPYAISPPSKQINTKSRHLKEAMREREADRGGFQSHTPTPFVATCGEKDLQTWTKTAP